MKLRSYTALFTERSDHAQNLQYRVVCAGRVLIVSASIVKMNRYSILFPIGAIVILVPGGCSNQKSSPVAKTSAPSTRPDDVVGHYVMDDPTAYGMGPTQTVPPGAVMHLAVDKDRWMMANARSGWGGPWQPTTSGAMFTTVMGPRGPVEKSRMTQTKANRTSMGITLERGTNISRYPKFRFVSKEIPQALRLRMDQFLNSTGDPQSQKSSKSR